MLEEKNIDFDIMLTVGLNVNCIWQFSEHFNIKMMQQGFIFMIVFLTIESVAMASDLCRRISADCAF